MLVWWGAASSEAQTHKRPGTIRVPESGGGGTASSHRAKSDYFVACRGRWGGRGRRSGKGVRVRTDGAPQAAMPEAVTFELRSTQRAPNAPPSARLAELLRGEGFRSLQGCASRLGIHVVVVGKAKRLPRLLAGSTQAAGKHSPPPRVMCAPTPLERRRSGCSGALARARAELTNTTTGGRSFWRGRKTRVPGHGCRAAKLTSKWLRNRRVATVSFNQKLLLQFPSVGPTVWTCLFRRMLHGRMSRLSLSPNPAYNKMHCNLHMPMPCDRPCCWVPLSLAHVMIGRKQRAWLLKRRFSFSAGK
ncbi:hypothetical protein BDY21DRAFT_80767 [Lineolata rhizophorae]|uniref:Uncharacterized protein n=1 Tax=Lineolata rhizophorae TaxID=578093 RepID=A0A6A6NTV9_9PEZI|nr:hypothetical protein BDY21DRAFT_80767 [Lineolata rhizophorae]